MLFSIYIYLYLSIYMHARTCENEFVAVALPRRNESATSSGLFPLEGRRAITACSPHSAERRFAATCADSITLLVSEWHICLCICICICRTIYLYLYIYRPTERNADSQQPMRNAQRWLTRRPPSPYLPPFLSLYTHTQYIYIHIHIYTYTYTYTYK